MQFGERAAGNWCRRKQMNTEDQPDTQCGKSLKEIEHAVTDLDNNSARSSAVVDPFLDGGVSPCLTIEPSNPRGVDNEFIRRGVLMPFCDLIPSFSGPMERGRSSVYCGSVTRQSSRSIPLMTSCTKAYVGEFQSKQVRTCGHFHAFVRQVRTQKFSTWANETHKYSSTGRAGRKSYLVYETPRDTKAI